jgi:hypothetical protein
MSGQSISTYPGMYKGKPVTLMNKDSYLAYATQRFTSSPLTTTKITNPEKYGIKTDANGYASASEWANFQWNVAQIEQGGQIYQYTTGKDDPGGSFGAHSVSVNDASAYAGYPKGSIAIDMLQHPELNTNVMASMLEAQVGKNGNIDDLYVRNGGSFAGGTMKKLAGGLDPSNTGNSKGTSLVNKTDPHGPTAVVDMNNMAKGVFSYPSPGAQLWVFFREGDPLFPVYFAASYGQTEWQSAFRQGSDTESYAPGGAKSNPDVTSDGGIMNLNGVGGIKWNNTRHATDDLQNQKTLTIFSDDGSNMLMGRGYHQFFSKFDRRDSVEGDRFNTTLGYKEEWVQGDSNQVVMGNHIVKIGNVSQAAVDAVQRIQDIIKEIHKPQTQ